MPVSDQLKRVRVSAGARPPGLAPRRTNTIGAGGDPAKNFGKSQGYATISDTQGGKALEDFLKQNPDLKWEDTKQLWKKGSQKYAEGVSDHYGPGGHAPAFLNG